MRWFVTGLMLCLPAAVQAEERCGSGTAAHGPLRMTVVITNADVGTHSPYVNVLAPNPDGSYELSVSYRPTEAGLGQPATLHVKALVPLSGPGEPEPHQIEWRAGSDPWFNPGYWNTPQRSLDEEETRGITGYQMAQAPPLPYRTELLEALAGGIRYEFRSLDQSGDIVGSGWVDYPAPQPIIAMYNQARAQAVAGLRPCGPPLYIRPAPDPWPTSAQACELMQAEARRLAHREPRREARAVVVEQVVDCEARTVTRVLAVESRTIRLAASAQQTADRLACSSRRNQIMYERDGWSFRVELRGPDQRAVTAAARHLPATIPFNDDPMSAECLYRVTSGHKRRKSAMGGMRTLGPNGLP